MLNNNLQNLRKRKGISQQEPADKVGVERQTISKCTTRKPTRCGSQVKERDLKRETSNLLPAKISLGACAVSFILLFLLSDVKKASDMSAYGSAYTEAWRYIFEYPLLILLLISVALLATGITLLIRERSRNP